VDAAWIEVDTMDGYNPGLEEIVAFVNGLDPDGLEPSTSSLSGCLGGLRDWAIAGLRQIGVSVADRDAPSMAVLTGTQRARASSS
jgi:hypothetical protein